MRSSALTRPHRRDADAARVAAPLGARKLGPAADAIASFVRNLGRLEQLATDAGAKPDGRARPA